MTLPASGRAVTLECSRRLMDEPSGPAAKPPKVEAKLPFVVGDVVVVRCANFRCLAYRDAEGTWRDAYHGQVLPEVLEIVSER